MGLKCVKPTGTAPGNSRPSNSACFCLQSRRIRGNLFTEEPAIAYHAGPVPEVMEEGTTGFIIDVRAHPTLS